MRGQPALISQSGTPVPHESRGYGLDPYINNSSLSTAAGLAHLGSDKQTPAAYLQRFVANASLATDLGAQLPSDALFTGVMEHLRAQGVSVEAVELKGPGNAIQFEEFDGTRNHTRFLIRVVPDDGPNAHPLNRLAEFAERQVGTQLAFMPHVNMSHLKTFDGCFMRDTPIGRLTVLTPELATFPERIDDPLSGIAWHELNHALLNQIQDLRIPTGFRGLVSGTIRGAADFPEGPIPYQTFFSMEEIKCAVGDFRRQDRILESGHDLPPAVRTHLEESRRGSLWKIAMFAERANAVIGAIRGENSLDQAFSIVEVGSPNRGLAAQVSFMGETPCVLEVPLLSRTVAPRDEVEQYLTSLEREAAKAIGIFRSNRARVLEGEDTRSGATVSPEEIFSGCGWLELGVAIGHSGVEFSSKSVDSPLVYGDYGIPSLCYKLEQRVLTLDLSNPDLDRNPELRHVVTATATHHVVAHLMIHPGSKAEFGTDPAPSSRPDDLRVVFSLPECTTESISARTAFTLESRKNDSGAVEIFVRPSEGAELSFGGAHAGSHGSAPEFPLLKGGTISYGNTPMPVLDFRMFTFSHIVAAPLRVIAKLAAPDLGPPTLSA